MPQIGPLEILVILIVALVVFGPSKLPKIGRQVGRAFQEFRKFQAGLRDDIEDAFRNEGTDEGDEPRQLEAGTPDSGTTDSEKRAEPPPADTTP